MARTRMTPMSLSMTDLLSAQRSAPREVRLPLLDEGRHSLLLVLEGEEAVEQAAFELDALGQRRLEGGVDHFLVGHDGQRALGGDLRGDLAGLVQQGLVRDDAAGEAGA